MMEPWTWHFEKMKWTGPFSTAADVQAHEYNSAWVRTFGWG
jgi:hypothetical protein